MSDDRPDLHHESTSATKAPQGSSIDVKNSNVFVRLYNKLGFKKGYNFVLWFIFGGAMVGFCLARFMYLNPSTMLNSLAPGEAYTFHKGGYKAGMLVHLATALPAGIIAVTQFIPAIRYKALIVHRTLGYIAIFLLFIGTGAAFAIMRRAFGGDIGIQSGVVVLGAATLVSVVLAWVNIKRLQIDQHRKWMLRTWFYAGSIITVRIVLIICTQIISAIGQYYTVWNCEEVAFTLGDSFQLAEQYPACSGGQPDPNTHIAVFAEWTTMVTVGSTFRATFGAAFWIGFFVHAIGVEIYIHLTPGETARLRKVSYEKQLEHGMSHPGSMGTVGDRIGDNFGVAYKPE